MDAMTLDPELLEGFFLDVDETFSPQVAKAMDTARRGDLHASVDMMLRPLHTIKGTAAFLGLDEISGFAHVVEDHLKVLQAGEAEPDTGFMLRCVDMVFHLLERARSGQSLEGAGHTELAGQIRAGGPRGMQNAVPGLLELRREGDVHLLQVLAPRIHLPHQYAPLLRELAALPDGSVALLDLSTVRTLNSTTWGGIWLAAGRLSLHVAGMGPACRSTFETWGFSARITAHDSPEAFWRSRSRE